MILSHYDIKASSDFLIVFCLEKEIGNSSFKHFCKFFLKTILVICLNKLGAFWLEGLQDTVVDPLLLANA